MRRLRIGVLFGGRSTEHEVSILSAQSIIAAMDPDRFEVVPLYIDKSGRWLFGGSLKRLIGDDAARQYVYLPPDPTQHSLVHARNGTESPSPLVGVGGASPSPLVGEGRGGGLPWWTLAALLTAWSLGMMAAVLLSPLVLWLVLRSPSGEDQFAQQPPPVVPFNPRVNPPL